MSIASRINRTGSTETTNERYSQRRDEKREQDPRATRFKVSHLCIVIVGCGPAFGHPAPALRAVDPARDLHKIVLVRRWPSWC